MLSKERHQTATGPNPLALYRLVDLQSKFSKPDSFHKTLEDHAKRVSWQIQRIYRERNTVMHNGEASPAIARLLSNTYYYYLLTFANIETVAKSYGDLSIPQTMSAMRKLNQADQAKIVKAKGLVKSKPSEVQAILLGLIAGHFHSDK